MSSRRVQVDRRTPFWGCITRGSVHDHQRGGSADKNPLTCGIVGADDPLSNNRGPESPTLEFVLPLPMRRIPLASVAPEG